MLLPRNAHTFLARLHSGMCLAFGRKVTDVLTTQSALQEDTPKERSVALQTELACIRAEIAALKADVAAIKKDLLIVRQGVGVLLVRRQ